MVGGLLAASGIGGVLKTAVQVSEGVAANSAASQMGGRISMTPTDYAIDRLLAPAPSKATAALAARAELSAPLTRTFAASLRSGQLEARNRTMLVQTVMQQTGLPQAEAESASTTPMVNSRRPSRTRATRPTRPARPD